MTDQTPDEGQGGGHNQRLEAQHEVLDSEREIVADEGQGGGHNERLEVRQVLDVDREIVADEGQGGGHNELGGDQLEQ